jgi:transposase InsO family protein
LPIAPNLLNRNFAVATPNRAWTGDITDIPTHEGWLFLAVVIDLFSRRVVGWSIQPEMHSNLVIDALEMAWLRRSPDGAEGHIFHSDRGSQYASHEFSGLPPNPRPDGEGRCIVKGRPPRDASKKTKQHMKAFVHRIFECAIKWTTSPCRAIPSNSST